ncbi:alpha/beta hydrolase family protein [Ornithinimicrobium faecis]|uniref:alpha/beta hydrolase family protein n=1 Tax=Ornithinimicrobium faecis TaxID=2934158 RepID=UPI0021191B3B|nr:prolyl oligopeptidase family serine peptidase [Ornithinimicrobium sp. HY1745]
MTAPGLRDLLLLEIALEVQLSPRGDRAAIRVEHPHWEDNRYCRDVIIVDVATGRQHRLTRFAACEQMHWLADDVLAVRTSDGSPEGTQQVHVYDGLVGDGWQVTQAEHGVDSFEPYAEGIVFLSRKSDDPEVEAREERFGTYVHVESEPGRTAAYYVDLPRLAEHERARARASKDEREVLIRPEIELSALLERPLAIQGVVASPAGDAVYVNARPTDELTTWRESSVHRLELDAGAAVEEFIRRESASKSKDHDAGIAEESDQRREQRDVSYLGTAAQLALPPRAALEAVSPEGDRLLISFPGRDTLVSTNTELWVGERDALLAATTAEQARTHLRDVTAGVDQACSSPIWHEHGIDVLHAESTRWAIRRLDPDGGQPQRVDTGEVWCHVSSAVPFHTTRSGQVSFVGGSASAYQEAWVTTEEGTRPLTQLGEQVADWDLGEVRTISWTSKDGTEIEGVLRLPPGFDPSVKHPLVFVVHGGPTWVDTEDLLPMTARHYYPGVQLAAQGVIVLHPNYRGSLGRGLDFQELNVGNLGVGDLWDLESAIDHLDELGWIDTERVGSMGWSQGGYISAFAGIRSDRFAAVSVGAGVSDWYTYAISNDIPDFTRDFLGIDLFGADRSALVESSPISGLDGADTPMLIQHGAKDQRVPLSNAMELYRGLQERGVPVELFVYPDFAHPVTRPREHHAVLHQNLTWFSHWLLGEELELQGPADRE